MAAKHDMSATVSAHNLPLASPPKRSRLDIFGASDASALKAASWHASASIAQDVEELHGRQAFTEDCGMANGCLSTVGSLESRSALERTAAVGASPLRRKAGGVTGVKPYVPQDKPDGCDMFDMELEDDDSCPSSKEASTGTQAGGTPGGPPATGASTPPQPAAASERSPQQIEGAVFAIDTEHERAPSSKKDTPSPADREPSTHGKMGADAPGAKASASDAPSEAEASALAVLHAMASGIVGGAGGGSEPASAGAASMTVPPPAGAGVFPGAGQVGAAQAPLLVKSDGTRIVMSPDLLRKMGLVSQGLGLAPPGRAPASDSNASASPAPAANVPAVPLESPATAAAGGFNGMSLDTPKGNGISVDSPLATQRPAGAELLGSCITPSCDSIVSAIKVLSGPSCAPAAAAADKVGGSSQLVAALAESIAGAQSDAAGNRFSHAVAAAEEAFGVDQPGGGDGAGLEDEGLSTADEAAIAALQELGSSAGRWGREGGRGSAASGAGGGAGGSINSRHGAARGRQVTRSCPGCSERISIACKFCTLCGYTFRRSSAASASAPTTPRDPAVSLASTDGAAGAAAGGGGSSDGGAIGGKTLSMLLKKGHGKTAGDSGEVLQAVGVLLGGESGHDRSKMATPVKSANGCESATEEGVARAGVEVGSPSVPGGARQTVTRVTPNSLELHKIKEQARRAREKQLLARLQSLLFDGRESPPSASEVTYNLVLTCAVESLRDRYLRRGMDLSHINIEDAIAPEPAVTPREPGGGNSSAEIEKVRTLHKIKEQQRRAKKRLLLSTLQSMVLGEGETNGKSSGITGNYILELVLVQLEKEKIETSSGGTGVAAHVKAEDGP